MSLSAAPSPLHTQALIVEDADFKHILRILNTNIHGKEKVVYALTEIRGVGRRFADIACKRANVDSKKRYVYAYNAFPSQQRSNLSLWSCRAPVDECRCSLYAPQRISLTHFSPIVLPPFFCPLVFPPPQRW